MPRRAFRPLHRRQSVQNAIMAVEAFGLNCEEFCGPNLESPSGFPQICKSTDEHLVIAVLPGCKLFLAKLELLHVAGKLFLAKSELLHMAGKLFVVSPQLLHLN